MKSSTILLGVALVGTALLCAGASAESMVNGSFEFEHDGLMPSGGTTEYHASWGMPDDWSWRKLGAMNAHGTRKDTGDRWASEGDWALYVFSANSGRHVPGDYLEFYQSVDLTGMNRLLFDAYLRGGDYTDSYVAVDSQKLWVRHEAGTLYDVSVDVSDYSGVHEIAVGVMVFQGFGESADGWTYYDNLRLVPEPSALGLLGLVALAWLPMRRRAV